MGGSLPWPEDPCSHSSCFSEAKRVSRRSTSGQSIAPGCFSTVWGLGAFFPGVWCTYKVNYCNFRGQNEQLGSTSRVSSHSRADLGGCQLSRFLGSLSPSGQKWWEVGQQWVQVAWLPIFREGFQRFLPPGWHTWVVPFWGAKCPLLLGLGNGSTIYKFKWTFF